MHAEMVQLGLRGVTIVKRWLPSPYTPYSARMSPENAHKLMGFYMEFLILGVIL